MKLSRYNSKLGPIPEDHFENDCIPDPEMMARRMRPEQAKAMDELLARNLAEARRLRALEKAKAQS